ncbi:MAG: DNA repair protein RecO, partial [Bacteroidaceae bacterium]|nr:DNA repair protein RecO [Bacteroidaceae bacterium]
QGQYLETADAVYLPLLLKTEYSQMHHYKLTRKQRWHMLEVILRYYQMHVPGFGELKSLMTLRELFS